MKKKFSTKTIVISALIVVLLAVGITGTVVFLKDSGEAEAAMEEQENLLPVTGRDDETEGNNEQVEPNEETEGEQAGNQEQNAEETENEETTTNNNQGTTNTNTTNTNTNTNQGNTETELIPTVIGTRERKIAEGLSLGWTTIKIPSIVSNLDIFKPEISIEKTATRVNDEKIKQVVAGDIVVYTIKVENTGNYKANNLIITDLLPVEFAKPEESDSNVTIDNETNQVIINELPAGTAFTIEAAYEVTQEDVDNLEKITNTAIVKYGEEEKEDEDDTVETLRKEDFEIYKTAKIQPREDEITPEKAEIGDKILYTITVKNTGTVTLKNILVADEMLEIEEEIDVLEVNETKTLTETYEVTKTDIDRALENEGIITNIAIATYAKEDEIVLEKEDEANAEIKMEYNYTVEYYYDGEKDTTKTDTIEATYQDVISTYTDKNITGYRLEKTENLPLTVSEVEANNVIKVYYVKDNFNYTVEYYYDGEKDTTKTDTIEATYQDVISTYTDKNITGYKLEKAENLPLTVSEVETNNVIKVYYVKRTDLSYTVNYLEKRTNKVLHDAKKLENQTFGTVITASINNELEVIEKPVAITGYSCVEVDKETMTIGIANNSINFYYTKNEYKYTVEHYWEGLNGQWEKDEISFPDEIKSALYEDIITEYDVHQRDGYVLSHATPPEDNTTNVSLQITENEDTNVIKVYYIRNNFNYTVKHYIEKLDGTWELKDTDTIENVKYGSEATYEPNIYKEYTFDDNKTTPKNATVPANNDLVINLYYTRKLCDYTVNFFIQGEQKPFETYSKSAKLGEVITVSQDEINTTKNQIPNAIIYEYVPGTTSVTIKDGENIINIYYKEIIRTASITENSTTIRKTNLVIVLDLSSSMENGTTRLANAKSAANKFIDQIYNNETVSGINIKVVTFNSRNPIITSTNYIGIIECTNADHYHGYFGSLGTDCKYIDGTWYSEYKEEYTYAAFSGTQALPVSGLTNNTATNYSEAQVLKTAINGIYIPSQYQDGGYGTHIYAALQEANTQISSLNTRYQNNESVVVFLGDGVPTSPRNGGDYIDNSNENIASAASILKGNATVYCIRLGKEAQGSTVFNTIATSSDKILDADTEGDLIDGFNAITSSENSRTFTSNNSANGIITITDVDLNIGTEKPLTVTKPDGTIDTFTTIDALNASGYISYTDNIITWDIKNYSKETLLTINYHIN